MLPHWLTRRALFDGFCGCVNRAPTPLPQQQLSPKGESRDSAGRDSSGRDVTQLPPAKAALPPLRTTKRWRRVPMGSVHEAFLSMFVHVTCDRTALAQRVLQARAVVSVAGHAPDVRCLEPPSEALLLDWFAQLMAAAPALLPHDYDKSDRAQLLQLARGAWDLLVVRATQLAVYVNLC